MAIGPKLLNENFLAEVADYEKKIDSKLSCHKLANGGIVSIKVPDGMNTSHFSVLNQRYVKAGWRDVAWRDDQRDGNFLIFKS